MLKVQSKCRNAVICVCIVTCSLCAKSRADNEFTPFTLVRLGGGPTSEVECDSFAIDGNDQGDPVVDDVSAFDTSVSTGLSGDLWTNGNWLSAFATCHDEEGGETKRACTTAVVSSATILNVSPGGWEEEPMWRGHALTNALWRTKPLAENPDIETGNLRATLVLMMKSADGTAQTQSTPFDNTSYVGAEAGDSYLGGISMGQAGWVVYWRQETSSVNSPSSPAVTGAAMLPPDGMKTLEVSQYVNTNHSSGYEMRAEVYCSGKLAWPGEPQQGGGSIDAANSANAIAYAVMRIDAYLEQ